MAQKRKRNKKWIYWLLMVVLLVAVGAVVYFVWDNYFRDKNGDNKEMATQTAEQEEKKVEGQALSNESDGREIDEEDAGKKVKQYEGEDPNRAAELSGSVTYAGVVDRKLMIRVNIDQYLTSGNCELALSKGGGGIYSETANIVGNASTATCEGFDVSVDKIGGGEIEIRINLSANGKTGVINGKVNI